MKGGESLPQVRFTWPIALRNHSVCEVRPSPEAMKSPRRFHLHVRQSTGAFECAEMRDEAFLHVSRQGLVVGEADVRFVRIVAFPKGVQQQERGVSLPCGEVTTRKKLTSVTKGPSAVSFRYMPGFSRTSQLRSD